MVLLRTDLVAMEPCGKLTARRRRLDADSRAEGLILESTKPGGKQADLSERSLRAARVDELETLCDIDVDACRLFDQARLELTPQNSLEFAAAERSRWLECLQSGTTFVASDQSGELVGFAALRVLDGEAYLEQLSVRMGSMRNGIGTTLLTAAERVAAKTRARALWLTTYRHLPWNAPFYERAGFVIVPVEECRNELLFELLLQRRLLPEPDKRVAMRKLVSVSN